MIRLQRIYNFLLLHVILYSVLDIIGIYYTLLYYFGTNLLTKGLVQIAVFFAYFSVSQKRNIKRNPNGTKPSRGSFLEQTQSRRLGVEVRDTMRRPRGRRVCPGGRRAPRPRGLLVDCLTSTPSPLDHVCSKNHTPEGFIPFDILFLRNSEIGKKQQFWAGPPVNRLVPKII